MQSNEFVDFFPGTISFNAVYYVESSENALPFRHNTAPIAIRPTIDGQNHMAEWGTNSSRGDWIVWDHVSVNVSKYADPRGPNSVIVRDNCPDKIVIGREGCTVRLQKLTNEIFNQTIRSQVSAGEKLVFHSDEDVQSYYLNTSFER